jgi:hypothetical protein
MKLRAFIRFVTVSDVSEITQFRVAIATNCAELTRSMKSICCTRYDLRTLQEIHFLKEAYAERGKARVKLSLHLTKKKTPWPESESELYRPSDRRSSAKLVPTFEGRGAPQFYSRGWVDPVPGPLILRKSGCAVNQTRTSGSVARNSGH